MECCGQRITGLELQVTNQPFVLHRCGLCETNYWLRDGKVVPFDEVATALREATEAKAARANRG